MDLNTSIDIFTSHILRIIQNNNNGIYSGTAINGFKTSKNTVKAYENILQHLNDQTNNQIDLNIDNIDQILVRLFSLSDVNNLGDISYLYLKRIIDSKIIINKQATKDQLSILSEIKNKADTAFQDLEIDEPFVQNNTQIHDQQQNSDSNSQALIITDTQISTNTTNTSTTITSNNIIPNSNQNLPNQANLNSLDNLDSFDVKSILLKLNDSILTIQQTMIDNNTSMNVKFEDLYSKINLKDSYYQNVDYSVLPLSKLNNLLSYRIKRILKHRHAISIQERHLKNNTRPRQIAHKLFTPFKKTTNFLNKMDCIIDEMQTKVIQLIIDDLTESINIVEKDIELIKQNMKKFIKDDKRVDELVCEIYEKETNKLKPIFNKSLNKLNNFKKETLLEIHKHEINDNELWINPKLFIETNSNENSFSNSSTTTNSSVNSKKTKKKNKKNKVQFKHNKDNKDYNKNPISSYQNENQESNSSRHNQRARSRSKQRNNTYYSNNNINYNDSNTNSNNKYNKYANNSSKQNQMNYTKWNSSLNSNSFSNQQQQSYQQQHNHAQTSNQNNLNQRRNNSVNFRTKSQTRNNI